MPTSRRGFLKTVTVAVGAASVAGAQLNAESSSLYEPEKAPDSPNEVLWYRQPAKTWLEAVPIGNGRISAMVFGGPEQELLQLNDGTLWAGGPHDYTSPEALAALPEIRKLVFAGKWNEAQQLVDSKFMGRPAGQSPYQTVGNIRLNFAHGEPVSGYRRELDLTTAIAKTTYMCGGVKFTREAFASAPQGVIVVRITANMAGSISFKAAFDSPQRSTVHLLGHDALTLTGLSGEAGGVAGAVKFQASVKVYATSGTVTTGSDYVNVSAADSVTLHIAVATSYKSWLDVSGDPAALVGSALKSAASKSYDSLRRAHVGDYRRLYNRVSINLGDAPPSKTPTDERVTRFHEGADPQLAALHFQYGRYLLISCSRNGGQPATLQGLWNDAVSPPWGSKYTININTEMNYWPAGPANLLECYQPLFEMLKQLSEAGKRAAKGLYGADGWVCHHNTDGWRGASPVDAAFYGMWPMGGAWLCKSLWDHYDYTRDVAALKEHYPIMKGAALFFLDTLIEEPRHGWLVTCPSISPEHGHHAGVSICAGPTMDTQILNDLFAACIQASELLDQDADLRDKWKHTRAQLAPMHIGKAGQLQEWLEDWDMDAEDIHHRHVSHLYGLYPSDQISRRHTPDLFTAARRSLEIRGDLATGWSLAWKINLWARLEEGERAYKLLGDLLTPDHTAPNLFDLHPPFQIDGNFGATAGIAEMLLQCRNGEIHLLPALPAAWPKGEVTGLLARGAFRIYLAWRDNKLLLARIESLAGAECALRLGEQTVTFPTRIGIKYSVDGALNVKHS